MSRKKILLVDDEVDLVELVKTRLEASRHDVVTAHDGLEGLAKATAERPDLILLDVIMPKPNGFEVLPQLKADVRTRDIPVIIMSVRAEPHAIDQARRLGAIDYIVKPFESGLLMERVQHTLAST